MSFKNSSSFSLLILFLISSLGICQTAAAQGDGVRLQWKWNPGEKLSVVSEQDISTGMNVGGQDMSTSNTTKTWMAWVVTDADSEGVGTVENRIERMTVNMTTMMGSLEFDSAEDNDDVDPQTTALAERLRPMIGAVTTQKITRNGEVKSLEFDEDLKESLRSIGGEASIKMFEDVTKNATLSFPEKPLEVGDSWKTEIDSVSQAGPVSLVSIYTYQGEAMVDSQSFHKFDVDVKMSFGGEMVTIDEQSTKGELYFDRDAGRMSHSRVEQEIQMTIRQDGKEAKQTLNQIATITLKPAE